jgi:hypothetical protein
MVVLYVLIVEIWRWIYHNLYVEIYILKLNDCVNIVLAVIFHLSCLFCVGQLSEAGSASVNRENIKI